MSHLSNWLTIANCLVDLYNVTNISISYRSLINIEYSPDNVQGSYAYPNASHTSPVVGLAPHYQGSVSQSQVYPPTAQGFAPAPMNPPQPYTASIPPNQAPQVQFIQPPQLSNMGASLPNAPPIITNLIYGPNPQLILCEHCSKEVKTDVKMSTNFNIWCSFGTCILMGCAAGCCLIPFFLPKNYDATHSCSSCGKVIGKYKAYTLR